METTACRQKRAADDYDSVLANLLALSIQSPEGLLPAMTRLNARLRAQQKLIQGFVSCTSDTEQNRAKHVRKRTLDEDIEAAQQVISKRSHIHQSSTFVPSAALSLNTSKEKEALNTRAEDTAGQHARSIEWYEFEKHKSLRDEAVFKHHISILNMEEFMDYCHD